MRLDNSCRSTRRITSLKRRWRVRCATLNTLGTLAARETLVALRLFYGVYRLDIIVHILETPVNMREQSRALRLVVDARDVMTHLFFFFLLLFGRRVGKVRPLGHARDPCIVPIHTHFACMTSEMLEKQVQLDLLQFLERHRRAARLFVFYPISRDVHRISANEAPCIVIRCSTEGHVRLFVLCGFIRYLGVSQR